MNVVLVLILTYQGQSYRPPFLSQSSVNQISRKQTRKPHKSADVANRTSRERRNCFTFCLQHEAGKMHFNCPAELSLSR